MWHCGKSICYQSANQLGLPSLLGRQWVATLAIGCFGCECKRQTRGDMCRPIIERYSLWTGVCLLHAQWPRNGRWAQWGGLWDSLLATGIICITCLLKTNAAALLLEFLSHCHYRNFLLVQNYNLQGTDGENMYSKSSRINRRIITASDHIFWPLIMS